MISRQQKEYLLLYQSGATMEEIAQKYGVNRSTVSRVIARAKRVSCPFSTDCQKCPMDDCVIKDEYAFLLNESEDFRKIK